MSFLADRTGDAKQSVPSVTRRDPVTLQKRSRSADSIIICCGNDNDEQTPKAEQDPIAHSEQSLPKATILEKRFRQPDCIKLCHAPPESQHSKFTGPLAHDNYRAAYAAGLCLPTASRGNLIALNNCKRVYIPPDRTTALLALRSLTPVDGAPSPRFAQPQQHPVVTVQPVANSDQFRGRPIQRRHHGFTPSQAQMDWNFARRSQ